MRIAWIVALFVGVLGVSPLVGGDRRARTEDGKDVILRDDGTWSFEEDDRKGKKGEKTALAYRGKQGRFTLHLAPGAWKKAAKPGNPAAEVQFSNKDGDVLAMIVAERIEVPLERLKKGALDNIRSIDKDATVVKEEKRTINGKAGLCLTVNAKVQGIAFTYLTFYYSGKEGSFQVITWTGGNTFMEARDEMNTFLNGFHVGKNKELPKEPPAR